MFFAALALTAIALPSAAAAARPAPKFLGGKPDQSAGAQVLATFRNVGIHGAYWLKFELRVMPRKGDERVLNGEMFGTQGADGPLTRLAVDDPANAGGSQRRLYLLHGGASPAAWTWNAGEHGVTPHALRTEDWLQAVQGTDLTLFDLQMPFLRWTDFVYEGVANVRGRPAHAFLLYPPESFVTATASETAPAAVRVFLDTQFSALTQAEWLDAGGKPLKTVTVLDLKKIGEQWLVKSIDLRNHQTRAKTRFAVTAAALDLALPAEAFAPDNLSRPAPAVPAEKIERL
ncbi:MAG: outer membrane lipoprotein-sorting protein [Opitutae bacterium]|nr:outer membrane lipoprotein-sorting protein [Opitutae bacterium]